MVSAKARLVRFDKALSSTTPLRDVKPAKDPAICSHCQAVWHRGKWSLDLAIRRDVQRWGAPIRVVCPACRSAKEGNPVGILYLAGSFLGEKREEILNLVRNAERTAMAKNPLERIIRITSDLRYPIVVETTSEKLARRLGRALSKACGGTLETRFSHEDKLVRVYWRRDAAGSVT
jgi:NMD protein affecting ribosome stability and mRNA decay